MEPEITINGARLTDGQVIALRVALATADWDCGDDDFGRQMTQGYKDRAREIFALMRRSERTNGE